MELRSARPTALAKATVVKKPGPTVVTLSSRCVLRLVGHEAGYDIRTVQQLPGHADMSTTIYTHLVSRADPESEVPDRL